MGERGKRSGGRAVIEEGTLQESFLFRMERLQVLSLDTSLSSWEQALVKKAIYATYLDCVEAGVANLARSQFQGPARRRRKAQIKKVSDN